MMRFLSAVLLGALFPGVGVFAASPNSSLFAARSGVMSYGVAIVLPPEPNYSVFTESELAELGRLLYPAEMKESATGVVWALGLQLNQGRGFPDAAARKRIDQLDPLERAKAAEVLSRVLHKSGSKESKR